MKGYELIELVKSILEKEIFVDLEYQIDLSITKKEIEIQLKKIPYDLGVEFKRP